MEDKDEKEYGCEITVIKPSKRLLTESCHKVCRASKNLYNAVLYVQRQNFFQNKSYIGEYAMMEYMQETKNPDYYSKDINAMTGNYVIKQIHGAYKTFFRLLEMKKNGEYKKCVSLPRYLPKDGENVASFYKQRIVQSTYEKEGLIHLSKTNIKFKSSIPFEKIQIVRVVPRNSFYELHVLYLLECDSPIVSENVAGMDLGVNNSMTIATTNSIPFIVKGGRLKSINQRWNKSIAHLRSRLDKAQKNFSKNKRRRTTKRMTLETNKRNCRIKDELHQTTSLVVGILKGLSISKLVIGHNKGWKHKPKLRKTIKQAFVQIPHSRIIEMLKYKCKRAGIEVIVAEEAYTSKCSFLDNEDVCKHETYKGKRIKRGLFKASDGTLINADVNAAFNILKKHLGMSLSDFDPVKVCSTPMVLRVGRDKPRCSTKTQVIRNPSDFQNRKHYPSIKRMANAINGR